MKAFKTKNDFIRFFAKIPAKNWMAGRWSNGQGQRCAISHLNTALKYDNDLRAEAYRTFHGLYKTDIDVLMNVNDNGHRNFNAKKLGLKESNIKGRILAYLKKK